MAETAPCPFFRCGDEAPRDWIPVHVFQLLNAFAFGIDVEVVVALLPEVVVVAFEFLGGLALERTQRVVEGVMFRLAEKQMDVFGHEHIPVHLEVVPDAQCLEPLFTGCVRRGGVQIWKSLIATEGDEV